MHRAGRRCKEHALVDESPLPVRLLELDINVLEPSLFSVISAFCTPRDNATDELRVEALDPAHAKTAKFFRDSAVA